MGPLIPNVSWKSGILSCGLKALPPITMQSPLREGTHPKVPVNSLWGERFSKLSPESCLNEGLRAQSMGEEYQQREK